MVIMWKDILKIDKSSEFWLYDPQISSTEIINMIRTPTGGKVVFDIRDKANGFPFDIEKYTDLKGVTEAKKKIQKSKKFTDREKLMIAANIKLPTATTTASMKNFSFFKKMKKTPENLAIADMIFKNKTKSDFLSQIMVAQAKDESKSKEEKNEELKEFEKNWDEMQNQIASEIETTTVEGLVIPANKSDLIDGQKYNVKGESLTWYEEENQFR